MKHKEKKTDSRLKISRLVSNVKYIIGYAYRLDRTVVLLLNFCFFCMAIIFSLYSSIFLKYFIEMLQDRRFSLTAVLLYAVGGCVLKIAAEVIDSVVENWAEYRFVKVAGTVQRDLIKKAADIDLVCYDNKAYYDDFVLAAQQSEEMMFQAILSTAEILAETISVFSVGIIVMTINPVVALFPVLGFLVNIVTRFRIAQLEYDYEMERQRLMRKADYSKRVFYQPEYAKEIKLSAIRVPLRYQFNEAIQETMDEAGRVGRKIAILSLINWITVFTVLAYFCPPLYLGYLALVKKSIALGDVAALNNSQDTIGNVLDGFNYSVIRFQKVGQFVERFRRFLDYEIQIENRKGTKKMPPKPALLEVKDMSFRYEGAKKDTLKHINMKIYPGEKVAFVGENGAGKTTFVKLLMHLYDVTDGSICYGGEDIREYNVQEYREKIGAVFQDYQLYGATLAENVMMDFVQENDEKKVKDALELAGFGKKLKRLEHGINTNMTKEFEKDGVMLSGGETQKVAVARMFAKAKKLSLAILDEPSSALDPLAEYQLNTNMMEQTKEASVIFISHRLSTTKEADRIYMFEHGCIIEEGTHEELMALGGEYAYMFEKQAHYYQDELAEG